MSYKTQSGVVDGRFHSINISNNSDVLPIKINNKRLDLTHILPKQTISSESRSYSSLLLKHPIHIKKEDLLTVDTEGNLHKVITADDIADLQTDAHTDGLIIRTGSVLSAGSHLQLKASPAPVVMTDTDGRLDSFNLWHSNFAPYVLGYADADKPDFYSQGLVRSGSAAHANMFLRKDGQWAMPSAYTGSVASNLLSLNDTPASYADSENKYLRVSYEGGGKVEFNQPTTDEIPEGSNLYYTDTRVETKASTLLSSGDLSSMLINGNITANSFISTSDRLKKTNLVRMDCRTCSDVIDDLIPYRYNLIGEEGNRTRYGFIAQDVQRKRPELVLTREDGTLGVDYIDIIASLVGKTQDLQRQIDALVGLEKKNERKPAN